MSGRRIAARGAAVVAAVSLAAGYAVPAGGSTVAKRAGLIAIEAHDGIDVVPAAGGQVRKIPGTLPGDGNPVWSPDGKQMSFERKRNGNWDIWVMNADGSGQRQLTFSRSADDFARWAPNGHRLVFQSARRGTEAVFVVNVETGAARRVTQPGKHPYWLANGRIMFAWDGDLYSVRPSGADRSLQATDLGGAISATASRDGHEIVYVTYSGIFTAHINGLRGSQLTANPNDDDPVFSPDARWVGFDRGNFVYVIRADGSQKNPEKVATGCCPDWSMTAKLP